MRLVRSVREIQPEHVYASEQQIAQHLGRVAGRTDSRHDLRVSHVLATGPWIDQRLGNAHRLGISERLVQTRSSG